MNKQAAEMWFQIVAQSQLEQIQEWIEENPQWICCRKPPLMHTAVFEVIKEREDFQGANIVRMLSKKGIDINAKNSLGQTALFYAVAHGKLQICKLLLNIGINPETQDEFGQTAKEYANALNKPEFVEVIEESLRHLRKQDRFSSQCPVSAQTTKKVVAPKLTYKLCKLMNTGRVMDVSSKELQKLQNNRKGIYFLLRNPQKNCEDKNAEKLLTPRQDWRVCGLKIIDKLWQLSSSFWFRHSASVWRVDKFGPDVPGVDLSVIRLKLQHHIYTNPRELRTDISNIYSNSKKRLGEGNEMTKSAWQLCRSFESLASEYFYNSYIIRAEK